jgi:hypothetical protein
MFLRNQEINMKTIAEEVKHSALADVPITTNLHTTLVKCATTKERNLVLAAYNCGVAVSVDVVLACEKVLSDG